MAYNWFFSYLIQRHKFVEFDHISSSSLRVQCGVPQGSNLGPLLFLLFISDLALASPKLNAILFADDSNLFCTGKTLPSLIRALNTELIVVVAWLNANKVPLNQEKSFYMISDQEIKKMDASDEILINGCKVELFQTTKFLSVIMDCDLTWKYHVIYICSIVYLRILDS